jgi:hypothetical protein
MHFQKAGESSKAANQLMLSAGYSVRKRAEKAASYPCGAPPEMWIPMPNKSGDRLKSVHIVTSTNSND